MIGYLARLAYAGKERASEEAGPRDDERNLQTPNKYWQSRNYLASPAKGQDMAREHTQTSVDVQEGPPR